MLPDARQLQRAGLWHTFPEAVMDEAAQLAAGELPRDEFEGEREDLRELKCYCIDDAGTGEVDDGIRYVCASRSFLAREVNEEVCSSAPWNTPPYRWTHFDSFTLGTDRSGVHPSTSLEHLGGGRVRAWVHVADATRFLRGGPPGGGGSEAAGAMWEEAERRAATLYLPGDTVYMFPAEASNGPMSLRAGADCTALSVGMVFDAESGALQPDETVMVPSLVRPSYQLTYDDADELLVMCPEEEPELAALKALAWKRRDLRRSKGALPLVQAGADVEVQGNFFYDESAGEALALDVRARALGLGACASRDVVAELMIAAGEAAALWAHDAGVPVPYRAQLPPREKESAGGGRGGRGRGRGGRGGKRRGKGGGGGNAITVANDSLLQSGLAPEVVAYRMRPSLMRGRIFTDAPRSHSGLGLPGYTQVTSPIRRYADCLAHAQIKAAVAGRAPPFAEGPLNDVCQAIAEQHREMQRLQRTTERYFVLEHLRQEGPERVYDALILGAARRTGGGGRVKPAWVLLEELGIEVPLMPNAVNTPAGARVPVRVGESRPKDGELTLEDAG